MDMGSVLRPYSRAATRIPPEQAQRDFALLADVVPPEALAQGFAHALRSDDTPPFPAIVADVFAHATPSDRAGMLNHLLGNMDPAEVSALSTSVLGALVRGGQQRTRLLPAEADDIPVAEVQQLAAQAERRNPGIADQMGRYLAQHPDVVRALGGTVLAVALGRVAQDLH